MLAANVGEKSPKHGMVWTNPSALSLAAGSDPLQVMASRARQTVLEAIQAGWSGPPYDPFMLADILKISVEPTQDVLDARTAPTKTGGFLIEFNPNRPLARINYSLAHEIAHTLFPDCAQSIRNRYTHAQMKADDWQLEMLCNFAAAEFLMPVGSFPLSESDNVSIEEVLKWRNKFAVSTEATLLRYVKLTPHPCAIFTAHRDESAASSRYVIDYAVSSRTWKTSLRTGFRLPADTSASECTGIGFTAKSEETWQLSDGPYRLECLGVPPYPGNTYPRVVGILKPRHTATSESLELKYLSGDATSPRGQGKKIIAQLVNDKALTWGRGFTVAVRKKWPDAQKRFTEWIVTQKTDSRLGSVHFATLGENLELASLVAQHGYGPAPGLRLRYAALESSLESLSQRARAVSATVHMPRIGCGEAGGNWEVVSDILDETLCRSGVHVTVYDLPGLGHASTSRSSGWLFGQSA